MTTQRTVQSLGITLIICIAGLVAVMLLTAQPTQAQQNAASTQQPTVTRWEYAIVRLEGPEPGNRDASLAVLRQYGENGWEAVELLPPAYDILMKRPIRK